MTRQQKYPDTKYFRFYNANPHGRITGDCVIRAIATATENEYNVVCMAEAVMRIESGYSLGNDGINWILERIGWKRQKQPRKANGKKYTGEEFCRAIQNGQFKELEGKRIVANIGGHHTVAIVDGKVWDTWDSTDGCIGNYWIKE